VGAVGATVIGLKVGAKVGIELGGVVVGGELDGRTVGEEEGSLSPFVLPKDRRTDCIFP
jgi:hypothetical protein